jgi:glycosyltransferase involved in cell wall biosynthesis
MSHNDTPQKLLFISIDFPPARTSGIYRPVFFTKYLIENGWDITLLTATTHLSTVEDKSLLDEIHPRLKIIRTSAPMPRKLSGKIYSKFKDSSAGNTEGKSKTSLKSRLFRLVKKLILSPAFHLLDNFILIPDNYIIWSLKNLFRAYRIIKKDSVSHLLVTSPPHSVQILGLMLRFLTGVRYITDYRNSWTDNQPYKYKIREKIEKRMERKSLLRSRAVINMSPGDVDRLLDRMPDIDKEKLFVVTNGFNEREFAGIGNNSTPDAGGPLSMLYVGSMYAHSGDSTVEALNILARKGYTENDIQFNIIGFSDESFDELVRKYDLGPIVKNHGFKNHEDLMRLYPTFDVMHLVTGGTPYYHRGALPGKIFEYMRLGKPILHAGIDGTTHDMLGNSGLEIFVPLEDVDGIAGVIIDLMERKKSASLSMPSNREYADSFEWCRLAEKVDQILTAAG